MGIRNTDALRWTMELAAKEFDIDRKTLSKRLRIAGVVSGADNKYSTADIVRTVFGDIEGERLRKLREEADEIALRNAKARGQQVPIEHVLKFCEGVGVVFRQAILTSSMTEREREDALANVVKLFDAGTVTEQVVA